MIPQTMALNPSPAELLGEDQDRGRADRERHAAGRDKVAVASRGRRVHPGQPDDERDRACQPGDPDEDLDDLERRHRLGLRLVGHRLGRHGLLAEHLEHPVGDDVAADDVHRRERDRHEATGSG